MPERATACWACRAPVDEGDRHCRRCGKRLQVDNQWYFRPLWIVVMTLTVLGPFTLPLVWRSPGLTRRQQWGLTVFIVGVTLLVFVLMYWIGIWMTRLFDDLAGLNGAGR
jgi:hypothetical protein